MVEDGRFPLGMRGTQLAHLVPQKRFINKMEEKIKQGPASLWALTAAWECRSNMGFLRHAGRKSASDPETNNKRKG